jgi:hypothetical protein
MESDWPQETRCRPLGLDDLGAEVERGAPDLMRCQRVETRGVPYVTR